MATTVGVCDQDAQTGGLPGEGEHGPGVQPVKNGEGNTSREQLWGPELPEFTSQLDSEIITETWPSQRGSMRAFNMN
jgi:hypothetical protein